MSLSKYYKDSSSFIAEEIVKAKPSEQKGWQSEAQPTPPLFEAAKISASPPHTLSKNTPKPTEKDASKEDSASPSSSEAAQSPIKDEAKTSIDLSNYVLIAEAEEQANSMYQQGLQEGVTKAAEDYNTAAKALVTTCEQLESIRETIVSNSAAELENFAILIAEKIIRISIKEQDKTIVATIEEALQRAVKSEEFTIFINPDDHKIISEKSADIIGGISGLTNIVIKTDPTIEKGGAKIESENCIIDATIASQFDAIREEILRDTN